jgi:hypothetical protein
MRLPLATNLESRDGDLNQDARIKNGYIDTEEKTPNVHKRPGISLVQTTGDGSIPNDIFVLDDVAYVWRESDPPGTPVVSVVNLTPSGFEDFQFDLSVLTQPAPSASSGAGMQLSSGSDIRCRAGAVLADNSMFQIAQIVMFFESLDGGVTYDSASSSIGYADVNAFIEVKLEAGNFNMYANSVLVLTLPNTFLSFVSTSLASDTSGSASVFNLQFTP